MKYIFLSLFIIATTLHLIASIKKNQKWRNYTKSFILIFLILFYISSVGKINIFLLLALIFSLAGDILLIPKGNKWFTIGGIAFMIGHVFFILAYCKVIEFNNLGFFSIVVPLILFIDLVALVFIHLKDALPKALFYPMMVYLLINGLMNCFAFYRMIDAVDIPSLITFLGAVLFFASDTSLFFVRFKKESIFKSHFFIMLTYALGELLIVLGMIL